jgi:hypothetical protein
LIAVALLAALLAGCGGGTKHAATPATTSSTPTATGPASKSIYQTRAMLVLRPMLHAIDAAIKTPRQTAVWQELHHRAVQAYVTIKSLSPPADISGLHHELVSALGNVASTGEELFHTLSAKDLARASALGERLAHEGQQITNVGNQLKARGYTQMGAILAGT